MAEKRFWRCTVCGDLHYGAQAPQICPTCNSPRSRAIEIKKEDFLKAIK